MPSMVNLEEAPGKTVGRVCRGPIDYDRLVRNASALMPRLPFPKGVYRFRSHEEANAWMDEQILRVALKKAPACPDATT